MHMQAWLHMHMHMHLLMHFHVDSTLLQQASIAQSLSPVSVNTFTDAYI